MIRENTLSRQSPDCGLWADWSDEDLLLEYRSSGDQAAFEEIVRRYREELFNYLRHYLGDAEMAEDAFQDAFLQVHLKCDQFEPGRRVRPWLYTVATNQAIDAMRRNKRHRMVSLDRRPGEESGYCEEGEGNTLTDLIDDGTPSAENVTELREESQLLQLAVDKLPDPLRAALELRYFQGLKYREVADVLYVPVGTVKSRLYAAIVKLRAAMEDKITVAPNIDNRQRTQKVASNRRVA